MAIRAGSMPSWCEWIGTSLSLYGLALYVLRRQLGILDRLNESPLRRFDTCLTAEVYVSCKAAD